MTRALALTLLRILIVVAACLFGVYWLVIRDMYYTPVEALRSGGGWPPASVHMVVPWPQNGRIDLIEGVTLALEELNAGNSPLAGRVRVEFVDEQEAERDYGAVARRIAADDSVVVVIGHENHERAIPSAVTYASSGILYLSPKATLPRLTEHAFQNVFRLVPDDADNSQALASYAQKQGWRRLGIFYGRFEQGEMLASRFSLNAVREGLTPLYFHSYLPAPDYRRQDFRVLLATMRTQATDAILLADQLPWAAKVLIDMQAMGFTQPVLADDNLDSSDTWRLAGTAANNLYVSSPVDPDSTDPAFVAFRRRFFDRFKADPGYGSSLGYEAFNLFVKAAELTQSVDPVLVATTLKTNEWNGLFGPYTFTVDGAIIGRKLTIKRMRDGVFRTVGYEKVEQ